MGRYAFIDIGISHMNFCIIDFTSKEQHEIIKWEMVDLTEGTAGEKHYCSCQKPAVVQHMDTDVYYCAKKSCQKTLDHTRLKDIKKVKCVRIGLEDIGLNIVRQFDKHPELDTCDTIYLENQPVYKQPTMKSVQIMLYMYLLMRMEHSQLEKKPFITMSHAKSKLDIYDGPTIDSGTKKDYALRKFLSVEYTKYFLKKYGKDEWLAFLLKQSKKDDFADSYISVLTKCCMNDDKEREKSEKKEKKEKVKQEKREKENHKKTKKNKKIVDSENLVVGGDESLNDLDS